MESNMWEAGLTLYSIIIYEKKKKLQGVKELETKTLISHPDIDFDMNREIDLKA